MPRNRSERIEMSLACAECGARNYKMTRKPSAVGQLELKKFCVTCGHHTMHRETK